MDWWRFHRIGGILLVYLVSVNLVNSVSNETLEYYTNTFKGNTLMELIVRDCKNTTFACVQKTMYHYLDDALDHDNEYDFNGILKLSRNNESYEVSDSNNDTENEEEENLTARNSHLEEITGALHGKAVKYMMTHNMQLQMPDMFFEGATLRVSPKNLDDSGLTAKFELIPKSINQDVGDPRIFKKIKKFIGEKLMNALLSIVLIVSLLSMKFMFFMPMLVGVAAAKKLLLKLLLLLFPFLSYVFKLCPYYEQAHGGLTKFHHHHHQISHLHHVPSHSHSHPPPIIHSHPPPIIHSHSPPEHHSHSPLHLVSHAHSSHVPSQVFSHSPSHAYLFSDAHSPSLLSNPPANQFSHPTNHLFRHPPTFEHHPSFDDDSFDILTDGSEFASPDYSSHRKTDSSYGNSGDENEIHSWFSGPPHEIEPNRRLHHVKRPLTPTEVKNLALVAEKETALKVRLQHEHQRVMAENKLLQQRIHQGLKLQEKLRKQSLQLNQKRVMETSHPVATGLVPGAIQPSPVHQIVATSQALPSQPPKEATNKVSKENPVATFDPFYSPILGRIDKVLLGIGFVDEPCRERLICSMYKNPTKFSPHSNVLSMELSRDATELQKPTSTNTAVIRFYRYVQAARDGQDKRECLRLYPSCIINTEI